MKENKKEYEVKFIYWNARLNDGSDATFHDTLAEAEQEVTYRLGCVKSDLALSKSSVQYQDAKLIQGIEILKQNFDEEGDLVDAAVVKTHLIENQKQTPQARYHAKFRKTYTLACYSNTEQDIINKLDSVSNLNGYVKSLIRKDIN